MKLRIRIIGALGVCALLVSVFFVSGIRPTSVGRSSFQIKERREYALSRTKQIMNEVYSIAQSDELRGSGKICGDRRVYSALHRSGSDTRCYDGSGFLILFHSSDVGGWICYDDQRRSALIGEAASRFSEDIALNCWSVGQRN